jgi:solute:Na+ symporter, SSS family
LFKAYLIPDGTLPVHPQIANLDMLILAGYLLAVLGIGIWAGRGRRDLIGYVLAGKDMPWWALLGSIVATETSTATFLSVPGISFQAGGDLRFLQLAVGFMIGRCLVAVWLLPSYFRGEILSAYELLEIRFGVAAKRTASLLFLVARNLSDGLRLFLAALALEAAFGISLPLSVAVIGGVTIAYTLLGGMRSVVWNDCLQLVVYVAGGLAALAIILDRLPGGSGQLWEFAVANDKLRWFRGAWDLSDPYTIWAGLIGGACLSLGTHGTDQMMVQRYLAARSQRDATKALVLSGLAVFVQFALFLGIGIALACFFQQFPPAVPIESGDKAFAMFIVGQLPSGLVGLTLAAVFAAVMSTLASSLNSSAAVAINDFGPSRQAAVTGERRVRWCQAATVAFGVIQMAVALAARYYSQSVVNDALAIAGFVGGILLGVFFVGLWAPRTGQTGVLLGMLGGAIAVLAVKLGTHLAWPWFTVVGFAVTFSLGWLTGLSRQRTGNDELRPGTQGQCKEEPRSEPP